MHNRAARARATAKAASRAQSGPDHISRVSARDDESASPTASSGHERLVKERGGDATLHPPTCGSAAPSVECSGNTDPSMDYAARWALYGVFRLWTNDYARPGEARETRRRQLCVHADWTGGLADRHAVGVAGHDVPQR